MPQDYNIKELNNKVMVTRYVTANLAEKHKGKTWQQLSTADKIDLIALQLGIINQEGEIICLKTL